MIEVALREVWLIRVGGESARTCKFLWWARHIPIHARTLALQLVFHAWNRLPVRKLWEDVVGLAQTPILGRWGGFETSGIRVLDIREEMTECGRVHGVQYVGEGRRFLRLDGALVRVAFQALFHKRIFLFSVVVYGRCCCRRNRIGFLVDPAENPIIQLKETTPITN